MQIVIKTILVYILFLLFFGCASKNNNTNITIKPAEYWYNNIIKEIRLGNLDKADDYYISLSSEHVASSLLKEALEILIKAHSENEEYKLAEFYIDEYLKRFATSKNIEYLKFLKIKSKFEAFKYQNRDQALLLNSIKYANNYLQKYPNSIYNPLVHTMLTRLYLSEYMLNQEIVKLYKKTGKEDGAKIYQQKLDNSWLNNTTIIAPKKSFLRKIFE